MPRWHSTASTQACLFVRQGSTQFSQPYWCYFLLIASWIERQTRLLRARGRTYPYYFRLTETCFLHKMPEDCFSGRPQLRLRKELIIIDLFPLIWPGKSLVLQCHMACFMNLACGRISAKCELVHSFPHCQRSTLASQICGGNQRAVAASRSFRKS